MGSTSADARGIDEARTTLCREFARLLNSGSWSVRVRIAGRFDKPEAAWFYAHTPNGWEKQARSISDLALVRALRETLGMLAGRTHGDEFSLRQHGSADWQDTDIQFHRDKLEQRVGLKLESELMGLLFRDSHDSKQDVRRSIRTRH